MLSMAHLPVSERYISCAFTQKIVKFSKMMLSLGHEVYIYGAEGSDAPCTKFFQTHTLQDIRDQFGEGDNRFDIGYNFEEKEGFKFDRGTSSKLILKMYKNAIKLVNENKKEDDFLVVTMGNYHEPIAKAVNMLLTIENGVAYAYSKAKFRAFESAQMQNYTYGMEAERLKEKYKKDGSFYDRVIPNYFDNKDYDFQPKKEDYFLYLGRIIPTKGINIAIETTKRIGAKLVIAGQGRLETTEKHVEFVGFADREKKRKLMAGAKGFFYPTIYIEPFGGAAVEAMLSGTPIITTNFGVFPEYNINGLTGYRCNTFQQFVNAAKNISKIDPYAVRKYAERFLMENIRWEFQEWLDDVYTVYEMRKGIRKMSWYFLEK